MFKILAKDKNSKARVGEVITSHGKIQTPAFIPVGTQATVKSIPPKDLKEIGVQIFFVNTYHLFLRPGENEVKELGGLHRFMSWDGPIITDSGGFQVFSLGRERLGNLIKISKAGVTFRSYLDGSKHHFTPEKSIQIQRKLEADLIVAFDECPPYPVSYTYAKTAMERTHQWAVRSLKEFQKSACKGAGIYGVVQGSTFKDLRITSAKFINGLDFDGIAIGGVSVGEPKRFITKVCEWVIPHFDEKRPRHLLGVGEIDDIFGCVEQGIDSFDCVIPTRWARNGYVLAIKSPKFRLNLNNSQYKSNNGPISEDCGCYTCQNFSLAYLNHLCKTKEILGVYLATYHNLWFLIDLMREIRKAIEKGRYKELKKQYIK